MAKPACGQSRNRISNDRPASLQDVLTVAKHRMIRFFLGVLPTVVVVCPRTVFPKNYVSTIKTNLKAKTGAPKVATKKKVAPKQKAAKAKRTAKKKVAKKKATKKLAPLAAPASSITYEQLKQAKEMAQQLGGIEKAKETLAALSALATD